MSAPIKLGSAAGTVLIMEKGSKITTSNSGVQSCSISALYGDGQNVWSVLPTAGTPFNEVFGNSYLPSDFKVDVTGGGFDIDYIEGKAAKVTIIFKRPDPTQPPGPNGQRARKVSVDSSINYKDLVGFSMGDESQSRYGFPEPVVTVTYNVDTSPGLSSSIMIQSGDVRATGFPETPDIFTPFSIAAFEGMTVQYIGPDGEPVSDGPLTDNYSYNFNLRFSPDPGGWKLTRHQWGPHADETFFDVTECWQMYYWVNSAVFISKTLK